ncbi:MAG: hypothetical protein PVH41_15565 [Anaerolineae bacterium]|jgi:hypothetical protein
MSADPRVSIRPRDPGAMDALPNPPPDLSTVRLLDLSAEGESTGIPVTGLDQEATLGVRLSEGEAGSVEATTLGVWRLGGGSISAGWTGHEQWGELAEAETWVMLPTEVEPGSRNLTATTELLGTFAVLGEPTSGRVYLPLLLRGEG